MLVQSLQGVESFTTLSLVDVKIGEVPSLDDAFRDRLVALLEKRGRPLTVQGILDYASDKGVSLFGIPYFQLLEILNQD